jgi:hypothetical protein
MKGRNFQEPKFYPPRVHTILCTTSKHEHPCIQKPARKQHNATGTTDSPTMISKKAAIVLVGTLLHKQSFQVCDATWSFPNTKHPCTKRSMANKYVIEDEGGFIIISGGFHIGCYY